jgi:hypothetical protein
LKYFSVKLQDSNYLDIAASRPFIMGPSHLTLPLFPDLCQANPRIYSQSTLKSSCLSKCGALRFKAAPSLREPPTGMETNRRWHWRCQAATVTLRRLIPNHIAVVQKRQRNMPQTAAFARPFVALAMGTGMIPSRVQLTLNAKAPKFLKNRETLIFQKLAGGDCSPPYQPAIKRNAV